MRILQIESSYNWGGQEERLLQEAIWLTKHGHPTAIACPPATVLAERAKASGIAHYSLMAKKHLQPAGIRDFLFARRDFRPSIIQTHSSIDSYLAAALNFGRCAIIRSQNKMLRSRKRWPSLEIYRLGNHHIVATSEQIRDDLERHAGVAKRKIDVIGSGVDLQRFRPDIDDKPLRRELGITAQQILLGVVAMLRHEKGIVPFIEAAALAYQKNPSLCFVIVGGEVKGGLSLASLRKRIKAAFPQANPPIHLLGFRDDVSEVMTSLDVLVVPSLNEAQSLVIPQAFATRKPVIATRVGGIPELVVDGANGLLVRPNDPVQLSEAMLSLAADPARRSEFAERGYHDAVNSLSFDVKMNRLLEVFQKTLAAR